MNPVINSAVFYIVGKKRIFKKFVELKNIVYLEYYGILIFIGGVFNGRIKGIS